ncbi:DUF1538 domain-containing protein [Gracilibacillus caseinilyticus]|uniref:DUF1538 domain-containing protein n=1 Tax=Gracilibacillus caseinilyticus TaxID=2932256 RepID=A0ABY4F379_9BACI|nr:DUF1538 domain-containing protein [Gracilibacillus caseinilyticus]UOQ48896.1 DUF1538 domain-containing protein [Gracilibacillus caseinilyticus]
MNILWSKLLEVVYAVLPITIIVIILQFTLTSLDITLIIRFLIGAVLIIIGLSIFLLGVDIGITPIGTQLGKTIAKSNRLWIVILAGLCLGFIISIAEPDLHILAGQVEMVTSSAIAKLTLVIVVSVGIAVMLSIGLIRIVHNIPLFKILTIIYGAVFLLALFTSPQFLAIAFDASGATTGAMTVPFILALSIGISVMKKDSKASEKDSFGLVAIASVGAIITVMLMSIFSRQSELASGTMEEEHHGTEALFMPFLQEFGHIAEEVILALSPIVILFFIFQKLSFKLSRESVRKIVTGLVFTFIGLVLFLVGVNAGFMELGTELGYSIASLEHKAYIVIVGLILGIVTILAEPAVYVLTNQIEDVTSGYVKRKVVLFTLAIGVGIAVALSMLRILIPGLQLWHYILPGYLIAIALMYITPKLFVGIAFDSGGVASGPMTATFILAFTHGAAEAIEGADVIVDGFGMIAMVALTPLITLQILGLIFKLKSKKGGMKT